MDRASLVLLGHRGRLADDGEPLLSDDVDLEEPRRLDLVHRPLRDLVALVPALERDEVRDRLGADDEPARVRRHVPGEFPDARGELENRAERLAVERNVAGGRRDRALLLDPVDRGEVRQPLDERIHLPLGNAERFRDLADRRARLERRVGADHRDTLRAVATEDVAEHLLAVVRAEIDVEVGKVRALGVEESLEEEVVPERIHVRDLERVRDEAVPGGAAPHRAHPAAPRESDDVPADEKVIGEPLRADDFELAIEGALRRGALALPHALLKPAQREATKLRERLLPRRERETRKLERMEIEVEAAAVRYLDSRLDRGGIVVKCAGNVRGRMEECLGRGRGAGRQRADRRARPDRREDAVHEVLARLEKIDVPRGDGTEAQARRLAAQPPAPLRPLAPDCRGERRERVLPTAEPRERPPVVGERVDILRERIERRAEREVRVEPPPRDETAELAVALARPGEERDAPDVTGKLHPVDRPDARLLARSLKRHDGVHPVRVGEGEGRHPRGGGRAREILDRPRAREHGEVRMYSKMYEAHASALPKAGAARPGYAARRRSSAA